MDNTNLLDVSSEELLEVYKNIISFIDYLDKEIEDTNKMMGDKNE